MNIAEIFSRIKNPVIAKRSSVAVCSMGGVGSTAFARHVGSFADKSPTEHAFSPNVYDDLSCLRLGYMFGNPYDAVLSVFRRDFQNMHARAMNYGTDSNIMNLKNVALKDYLALGRDAFNIERQLENWLYPKYVKHPTVLIKYESMGSHIDKLLAFFDCESPFNVKKRKSSWKDESQEIIEGLMKIYGRVANIIDGEPETRVLLPNDWSYLDHRLSVG